MFFLLLIAQFGQIRQKWSLQILSPESPTPALNAIVPKLSLIHPDGLSCKSNSEWISLAKLINDTEF